ncbi:MAG: hypothetical protein QF731_06045 [Verrucomicrobiota bacterium]|jgi:hypothetical protein|nr:hypothetical protein [Verrucomicrobiota bacterium]
MRWFVFIVLMSVVLLVGCTTSTITNLTPRQLPRASAGLYPVEAMFQSNQRTLDHGSMKPLVIFNNQAYPMSRTKLVEGRWETLIPIPVGTQVINYHFKFDYNYNAIMMRNADSKLSPPYQLKIVDQGDSGGLLMERED